MQFILGIDVGNTSVKCGLWNSQLKMHGIFDFSSHKITSSQDWIHYFSKGLEHYKVSLNEIQTIRVSSVKPLLNNELKRACSELFGKSPTFLNSTNCKPLTFAIDNPSSAGADLIAIALAAHAYYPKQDVLIASFGTATTVSLVLKGGIYAGVAILPGFVLCRDSLTENTALLPKTSIRIPKHFLGKNTEDAILAGIYASQMGAVEHIVRLFNQTIFLGSKPTLIGAGGFSNLLKDEKIFSKVIPNLVLEGLMIADL